MMVWDAVQTEITDVWVLSFKSTFGQESLRFSTGGVLCYDAAETEGVRQGRVNTVKN